MLKKLILAVIGCTAGLALSVPALADHGHRGYGHYKHKHRVVVHERHIVHRPAIVHHYYRPAPRPVYVVHPAPRPAPVIVHHHDPVPLLFGAIIGAAVVHSVISH